MITSLLPFKVLILLVAACLAWIGLLSAAFLMLGGTTVATGWIVAGALALAALAWILVMFREIQNSVQMPDHFTNDEPMSGDVNVLGRSRIVRITPTSRDRKVSDRRQMALVGSSKTRPRHGRSLRAGHSGSPNIVEFFHPDV